MRSINIEEIRKRGRPLWMTNWNVESLSELVGGGGDVWTDRVLGEWERVKGEEIEK